jgi:hypothetical protein
MNELQKIEAAEAASHASPELAWPHHATPSDAKPSLDAASYHRKLGRVLDRMGGMYLLSDILAAIHDGKMQSFCSGNSWAITEVVVSPRARRLHLVALVGDLADVDALHEQILAFADQANCGLLSTYGRMGWLREGSWRRFGWRLKAKNYLYHREM